ILIRCRSIVSRATRLDSLIISESTVTQRRTGAFVFILVAGAAGLLTLGSVRMMRRITGPLDRLRHGTEVIGSGDLTHRIGLSSTDEIGRLGQAFDRMADELRATTVSRDALAAEMQHRKKAEERVRDSEERYRTLFNSMDEGFCIIEVLFDAGDNPIDYRFLEINAAFEKQTGFKDAQGKLMRDLAPGHEQYWFDIFGKVALTSEPVSLENRAEALGRWYEVSAFPTGLPQSRQVGIVFNDITERKQTEEEKQKLLATVQQERDRLSSLLGSINDEVWFADSEKKFTLVNPAGRREFSVRFGEALQVEELAATLEVYRPDGTLRPVDETPPLRALRGEVVKDQEEIIRTPATGELCYRQVSAAPVRDASGAIIGSVSVVRDITKRKRAEESLRRSEAMLSQAEKIANIGSWEWDITSGELVWSEQTYRIFGLDPEGFVPTYDSFLVHIHPEDRQIVVQAIEDALADRRPYDVEYRIVLPGSSTKWIYARAEVVFEAAGQPARMIGTSLDITERKRAEEELRESERRERERAAELAALLEAVPTPVFIAHDPNGLHLTGNRAADELLRNPRGAEASLSASSETRPRHFRAVKDGRDLSNEELPAQRAARGFPVQDFEFDLVFGDGTIRHVLGYGMPLRDEEGRPRGAVHVLVDITEIKQAEKSLRELNATLESKVAQRTAELQRRAGQLQKLTLELSQAEERERRRIAVILHEDLQQQIAGARFHLSLLKGRPKQDSRREVIEKIDEMLKEAIQKSRSLSHDLSPPVLDMNNLTEVLQWLAQWARARHGLTVDLSGVAILQSEALTMFLVRGAQEMLFNVVKHAQVKEAAIRVRRIGHYVCLSVSDQGRGFDPQALKETAGLGLLSIRERVELLGGRMKIKSVPGKGTRCHLVVPDLPRIDGKGHKTEDAGQRADEITSPSSVVPPASFNGALRVVLVDDHEIVRHGLVALLKDVPDIQVVGEASNGQEAVNLAWELRPDVLIMDVSMPVLSGQEATCQIKARLPEIRIVALSMYEEPETIDKMIQAGAESYLLKTVPSEELLAAIRGRARK
ncbi:MAG: PAS domain S-box protein, partial [Acidobacteria bacterium]